MKYFLGTILILGIVFLLSGNALALTVSPVKAEIFGDPGQTIQGELILSNEQKETKTFYASFENFEAQGETGTPNFVSSKEGLAAWITAPTEITLQPEEKVIIPFSIVIPQNAEPGGHFAAIFWSTALPEAQGGGQMAVGAKIGSLILLKVSGEIKEGGGILEFSSQNKQKFFSVLPISFEYRFQNSGGDRVKPEGEIKIKNLFGGTSVTLDANKGQGNILPASIRKFKVSWTGKEVKREGFFGMVKRQFSNIVFGRNIFIASIHEFDVSLTGEEVKIEKKGFFAMVKKQWSNFTLGRYTAELNIKYGAENKEANASYSFFVIPWQLLSIVFVILVILGFLGVIGMKKWDRWIIAKATGQIK